MKTIATVLIYSPWGLTELAREPSDDDRQLNEQTESKPNVRCSESSSAALLLKPWFEIP